MHASGNPKAALVLLTALLFPGGTVSAEDGAPAVNPFGNVAQPAPVPGPEVEWVFNQPAPEERVRTVFDLEAMDVEGGFREFRAANAGLIGGVAPAKMGVAAALDAMRGLLAAPQTQEALATIRAHPALQTAAALENFADAAFATGHPLFALCGLWVIEERWPGNPDVRFNLAGLLAQHGAVNEAQALLDDLVVRQKLPVHPFGITPRQGGDYLRAYILTRQGRAEEAARLLRPIVAANPSFGEAALLFALVGEPEEEARKAYTMGIWRRKPPARPPGAEVSDGTGGKTDGGKGTEGKKRPPKRSHTRRTGLDPALLVDLSKGKPGELPSIPQPVSLEDRIEFLKWVEPAMQETTAESMALLQTRDALMERCRQKSLPKPVRRRLKALERIIEPENSHLPELLALGKARNQAVADKTNAHQRIGEKFYQMAGEISGRFDLDSDKKCALITPLAEAADASMRVHVQAVDLATRRLHRRWHQYATALGALTADPDFRAYLEAQIKASSQVTYGMLLANMAQSCSFLGCEPKKPGQKNELGKTEGGGIAKCSEEDAKNSVGAEVSGDLGSRVKPIDVSVGIEVTCDGFSLEMGTELFKSVGLSAEAEFKIDGTCTLYLGPKATLGVGGEFISKEASIKGGVYLTMDKDSFTDVGVKSVEKTTSKIAALGVSGTVSHTEGEQKHSFFPGPNSGRNASGLAEFR